jgi:hypothetical protein
MKEKSARDIFDGALETIRATADGFSERDDDLLSTLVVETEDGEIAVVSLVVEHDSLGEAIASAVRRLRARRVVFSTSMWALKEDSLSAQLGLSPKDSPERIELVVVHELTARGTHRIATARLARSDDAPPQLDEWEKNDEGSLGELTIQVVQALREVVS